MELSEERISMFKSVWENLRVPVRPGIEGLDLYRQQMELYDEKHILILGATPELVDLALELDATTITSIERNPEIMEAMKRISEKSWDRVQMVPADWLKKNDAFAGKFNIVVCDGGLLFLKFPEQWELLFSHVKNYLVDGGRFVAKEWAEPVSGLDYASSKQELLNKYLNNGYSYAGDPLEAFKIFVSELRLMVFYGATNEDGSFDQPLIIDRLNTLIPELEEQFPENIHITHGALKYLARSQEKVTDTVAGAVYERAQKLLAEQGFTCTHHPLPDEPVFGGNYMFVAIKGQG
jgi:hypothetical protein